MIKFNYIIIATGGFFNETIIAFYCRHAPAAIVSITKFGLIQIVLNCNIYAKARFKLKHNDPYVDHHQDSPIPKLLLFRPLFLLFSSFQTLITIFTTNKCEKCLSSIRCRDSNSQPLEHESPPITTWPGLPPFQKNVFYTFNENSQYLLKSYCGILSNTTTQYNHFTIIID